MPTRRAIPWIALFALLLLFLPGPGRLSPTAADPSCLYTEDGRCIPLPRPPGDAPQVERRAQAPPSGPAVLVKRRASIPPAVFGRRLEAHGFAQAEGLLLPGWWRIPVPPGQTAGALIARLQAWPEVEVAEEDRPVQALFTPNDPGYSHQWGLPKVSAPGAWAVTRGSRDVWIAVVDTGIDYLHPDRPLYLWLGYDFANNDPDPFDDHGHGTHVTGIAAAATHNSVGVAGLCHDCEVLAVKVLDFRGEGHGSWVADGIRYAADWGASQSKRTVINLSLGMAGSCPQILADAVSYAQSRGALVVAAAGNSGPGPAGCPASLSGVLAVSATDQNDRPAGFSQFGGIAAPGVWILSTIPGGYAYAEGTSMASPFVAAAAGLVWSAFPPCSAGQVRTRLLDSVDVPAGWDTSYGAGRLNAHRALASAPPAEPPTPTRTPFVARVGVVYLPLVMR
jgi:thermitase